MIAVSMGDIDRGEILAARDDPIQQSLQLLGGETALSGTVQGSGYCNRVPGAHNSVRILRFANAEMPTERRLGKRFRRCSVERPLRSRGKEGWLNTRQVWRPACTE
jgi:hypothetical protein